MCPDQPKAPPTQHQVMHLAQQLSDGMTPQQVLAAWPDLGPEKAPQDTTPEPSAPPSARPSALAQMFAAALIQQLAPAESQDQAGTRPKTDPEMITRAYQELCTLRETAQRAQMELAVARAALAAHQRAAAVARDLAQDREAILTAALLDRPHQP